ncbi:tRNA lysidine(34) synthetase TilS [Methylobacterium sp. A54F]
MLDHHGHDAPCLLAVSGGPDSTALMHVAAAGAGGSYHVATVDHGLRPESSSEAEAVARAASGLGLVHHTLPWTGERPTSGLQAAARAARYRLLAACAGKIGARLILTAHTRDDQAETVLMRLIAGSGLEGLAGMSAMRSLGPGLRLGRPFLGIPKADLVAWCDARGIGYLRDPSNADPRFARSRLRRMMPILAAEGLGTARLARLAERATRDEAALKQAARAALDTVRHVGPGPALHIDGRALVALPEAVVLRLVDLALGDAGGEPVRRLERLERLVLTGLLPALREGRPLRRTLRGLVVAVRADGLVSLRPELPRRSDRPAHQPCREAGAAGGPELLGKGRGAAYIDEACAAGSPTSGEGPARSKD